VTRPIISYYVKYGPPSWEPECPRSPDGKHCYHWYEDVEPCCHCPTLGLAEGVDPRSWPSPAPTAGAGQLAADPPGGECPPTPQNANGSHRALGHPHCKNPNLKVIA
jgi:hypothetical protein